MTAYSLQQIAEHIGATIVGDADQEVTDLATLDTAGKGQISFLANSKYASQLSHTQATAVIVMAAQAENCPCAALVMDNPYVGFALAAQLMDTTPKAASEIAPSAVIDASANLGKNVVVGANAVVEAGVTLGDNVEVGAGCFIGRNVVIGAHTKLWANVSVYHDCTIGEHCLFQSGVVIGSDGFGYANDNGAWVKIPQLGGVEIGDRVEIGANSTIDRGALADTRIESGVIIDNLCQIAHNVVMKANVAMAGCSVIAGSTTIGESCSMGGQTGIAGHVNIGANVHFTGKSMVTKDIQEPGVYSSGLPVQPNKDWRRTIANVRGLTKLSQRVKELEKHHKPRN